MWYSNASIIRSKQSNGKLFKRLKKAWYQKDIVLWFEMLIKCGFITMKDIDNNSGNFLRLSSMWNNRPEVYHNPGSYDGWNPYCDNLKKSCTGTTRMIRTDYGWKCPKCNNTIGKHLYRIDIKEYIPSQKSI